MPGTQNINPAEKNPSQIPNQGIEDIFEHEGEANQQLTQSEKIPEQQISEQPERRIEQPAERQVETEAAPETQETQPQEASREDEMSQMQPAPAPQTQPEPQTMQQKSIELVKIENILSENLDELFLQMTPQQQMEFKVKGEETASKINELLQETKVKVKEIITLIKDWLKIIPGISKFFLEQEAKIKTDRLLNIREQKK